MHILLLSRFSELYLNITREYTDTSSTMIWESSIKDFDHIDFHYGSFLEPYFWKFPYIKKYLLDKHSINAFPVKKRYELVSSDITILIADPNDFVKLSSMG